VPELPEVETVARQLAPLLVGRVVRELRVTDPLLRLGRRLPTVRGRRVTAVTRSGKRVVLELSPRASRDSALWLVIHLRMTGRLVWRAHERDEETEKPRARITLDRGAVVFLDTRRFGTLDWYDREEAARPAGLDPLSRELSLPALAALVRGSRQNVKAWLLRQDRLTGIGNIYASEILHDAGIGPRRRAGSLGTDETRRLRASMRRILERAIRHCGTTFSDFQDARGLEGSYQQYLAVYDREGQPCRRCRKAIARIVQQQRATYFCRGCQR
jgi:formamidopyrimidine-DNA glycosylase